MTTHHLLHHFAPITEAPAAVTRLRQLVLDLAVRGKLVAQEPADEPANVLLDLIQAEKEQLALRGEIKKQVQTPVENDESLPLVPKSWRWSRLQDIFLVITDGEHQPPPQSEDGIPFLVIGNIRNRTLNFFGCRYVPESYYVGLDPIRRPVKGDILYTLVGSYGIPVLVQDDRPFCIQRHIGILRPSKQVNTRFLTYMLDSSIVFDQATACATGIAQKTVPLGGLRKIMIPLPPLAEQQRIVAKVDELMTLCDELAAAQSEREAHRDRLVAATLHRLTAAPTDDPAPFPERARFYFNHLPRLTTRPEHIQGLRQTILNLAVQGKLVPQDPHDEPASELLKRIQVEREKLAKEGKISKGQLSPPLNADEMPFQIPATWQWVRVAEVADNRLGKMLDKAKNKGALHRYLRNVNVRWFDFDLLDLAEMKFEDTELDEFSLRQGDVLICEGGEPGRSAVWDERDTDIYFQKAIHRVRFLGSIIPIYFVRALYQDACSGRLNQFFTGVGIKHFTGKELARYTFPLPPLAEQQRIVARVDELLALCDALAANLDTVTATRRRLLEAALAEALAAA